MRIHTAYGGIKVWKRVSGGWWVVFNDDKYFGIHTDGVHLTNMKVIGVDEI